MTAWGWPSQIKQLETITKHLMKVKEDLNSIEQHWYKNFLKQHSEFRTQYSRNFNQNRKDAENLKFIKKWFSLYNLTQIQYGVTDSDIYNMNEKEFSMSITDSFKVLVWHSEAQAFSVQTDNQNWVSVIEWIRFTDNVLSLYIIFHDKQIQKVWLNSIKNERTTLQISDNEWTTNAIKC